MKTVIDLSTAFLGRKIVEGSFRLQMVVAIATMSISDLIDLAEWIAYKKTRGGDG